MSMQDPLADMFTRIRNAQMAEKVTVTMPASKMKKSIAKVLQDEGFIDGYSVSADSKPTLEITLRYFEGKPVIESIKRASRPGLRQYGGKNTLPTVANGLGVALVSTSKGVMTDRAARKEGIGGEIICTVF